MVRRFFHVTLQFLGVLVVGALIAGAVLAWRLSAGPISIAFLTPFFEDALTPAEGSYTIRIEDTILDWSEEARTLGVKLIGANVFDSEDVLVLQAPELHVSLSAAALLQGEIAPRELSIAGAKLRITRTEAGELTLATESGSQATPEGAASTLADIVAGDAGRAAGYLTRLNILNAQLAIDDRRLGIQWTAPDLNIALVRNATGISGVTELDLKVAGQIASVLVNADYRSRSGDLALQIGFAELRPSALASVSERLAVLAPFDLPFGGTVAIEITRAGKVERAEFNVASSPGHIRLDAPAPIDIAVTEARMRGTYEIAGGLVTVDELAVAFDESQMLMLPEPISHPLPARELTAYGSWSVTTNEIDIPAFKLTLDRPIVEGSLAARREDGGMTLDASARGQGFTFDDIARYWPATLGGSPRAWVTEHMPSGRVTEANATASVRWRADGGFELVSIAGELAADELVVDYLPPMPKVTKGVAKATFDRYKFDISILGGEAAGLTAREGRIVIADLDKYDQWTDLDLRITGPLSAALATIDSKPFEFAKAVGLSPRSATGETSTRLKLRFIAENKLTLNDIKVNAEATIKDAALPGLAFGLDLSQGNLSLVVDNAGMDVKGTAVLAGLPSQIEWRQNFGKKPPFVTRYRVKSTADAAQWREAAGLDWETLGPDALSGPIGAELVATLGEAGRGTVVADIVFDDADIDLTLLGYAKPASARARAHIEATLDKGHVAALPKISLTGNDLAVDADVVFASDGKIASARIGRFLVGQTDVAGAVFPRPSGWEVDIHGRQLDLKAFMEDETPEDPNAPRGDSFAVSLKVDRVRLHEDRYIGPVEGTLGYDGLVVRQLRLTSGLEDGGTLKVEVTPEGAGRNVSITSDNAGGVLRALDVNDNVAGGRLAISGAYAGMVPGSCLSGRVSVDDYRIRNAPILARLLNAASVVGLLQALGGEGIHFDTLRVPFTRKDGITRFENGKASGISIGLTASGWANDREDTIEVEGSIIPANVLNGVLGKIPLVGGLFGGEGGIFAINYRVAGTEEDPEVTANPLTVLTPGFTRNIFNLFQDRDEQTTPGCPKAS